VLESGGLWVSNQKGKKKIGNVTFLKIGNEILVITQKSPMELHRSSVSIRGEQQMFQKKRTARHCR